MGMLHVLDARCSMLEGTKSSVSKFIDRSDICQYSAVSKEYRIFNKQRWNFEIESNKFYLLRKSLPVRGTRFVSKQHMQNAECRHATNVETRTVQNHNKQRIQSKS
jgi:hypothetical protein